MALQVKNLGEAFLKRCALSGTKTAFGYKENLRWKEITWNEILQRVLHIAGGLESVGLVRKSRIAILSQTRIEWALFDYAAQAFGGVSVPIYPSLLSNDIEHIINNSDTEFLVAESREQLEKVQAVWSRCPKLKNIVVLDGSVDEQRAQFGMIYGLHVFEKRKKLTLADLEQRSAATLYEDMATIIYTSGTTGVPKGAVLTHRCFVTIKNEISFLKIKETDRALAFLPFSHIFGRLELWNAIFWGIELYFAQSINTLVDDLLVARPTRMAAVPRIFEKVYSKILEGVEKSPPAKRKIFQWASKIGDQVSRKLEKKESLPIVLTLQKKLADKLVFSKIRARFGGRLKFAISGGAPLSEQIGRFFHACGIQILEGYGLTETTGPATVNRPDDFRIGTVGKIFSDHQIKIAPDGEVLIKGSCVFSGYWKMKAETEAVMLEGGWFASGDIGEINDGFLKITDRKKDLIVTAAGKKIAPQQVENLLKLQPPISFAVVFGDKQKYIAALLTLNRLTIEAYAKEKGINFDSWEALSRNPQIMDWVNQSVHSVNTQLPSFSTIKKFKIIQNDFSVEGGELTPSLKVKRRVCSEKFKREIEELFV